jgi:acetyl esterase/lipase
MKPMAYGIAGLLIVLGLLYHFAALRIFNIFVPKDGGGALVAESVAYGPETRQSLDIYRPQGAGPFPVLLFAYGGSWDSGRKEDYTFVGRAFASRGFLTAIADYRLVPSVHYPDFVGDTEKAIIWLSTHAANFGGREGPIFVAGHSAGAYNIVQAALRSGVSQRVKAIAALAAPLDFLPLDSPKSIAAFAQAPDLPQTQPVNQDLSQAPPLLLLHGGSDKTVGLHNSRNMQKKYLEAGRTADLKIYDNVSHVGILLSLSSSLRGTASTLDDVVNFFQRYD